MGFKKLYECSVCGKAVKVKVIPESEPEKKFSCSHTDAVIIANRKVTLRGEGGIKMHHKITLSLRQFLSQLLGISL